MWTLEFEHGIAAIQRNAELADTMSRQIKIWLKSYFNLVWAGLEQCDGSGSKDCERHQLQRVARRHSDWARGPHEVHLCQNAMFDRLKMINTFSCGNYTYEDYGKAGPEVYLEMTSKWSNLMKNASEPNWTSQRPSEERLTLRIGHSSDQCFDVQSHCTTSVRPTHERRVIIWNWLW